MAMLGLATFTLVAGLIDDMRSRKVHNELILALLALVAGSCLYFTGLDGLMTGTGATLLALVLTVPLFAFRIIGGGDVKLFAVFALAVNPFVMFWTLIYSFFWGALFGITRAAISNQLLAVVKNTTKVGRRQKVEAQHIHKIPYTFALLLGWLTQLTYLRITGAV